MSIIKKIEEAKFLIETKYNGDDEAQHSKEDDIRKEFLEWIVSLDDFKDKNV